MLNIHKINMFVRDEAMVDAVYEVVRDSFLSKKGTRDIQVMAAERLAVDLLEEAWKALKRYSDQSNEERKVNDQVGL